MINAQRYSEEKRLNQIAIIAVFAFIAVVLALFLLFSMFTSDAQRVVPGVKIGSNVVGGLSASALDSEIARSVAPALESGQIRMLCAGSAHVLTAKDIGASMDTQKTADEALAVGRSGDIVRNFFDFYKSAIFGLTIKADLNVEESKIRQAVLDFSKEVSRVGAEAKYVVTGENIYFVGGSDSHVVNEDLVTQQLMSKFQNLDFSDMAVDLYVREPLPIDFAAVRNEVYREMKNAEAKLSDEGEVFVEPELTGIDFDVDEARLCWEKSGGNDKMVQLSLIVTAPEITEIELRSRLFLDELSSYSTTLNPGLVNRTHNIRLACQKINEKIILPGEVFSFNSTVGPREYSTGFRDAIIFVKDEMVDGVGGGICQVSSTIYACAIMADLEIVARSCHRFKVTYTPLGWDATVAWGSIDYKFKNSTNFPIKIMTEQVGNKVNVKLLGTKTEDRYAEFTTKSYNPTPSYEKIIDDDTLAPGTEIIEQNGMGGLTVEAYRNVYVNGELVSTTLESTSKYYAAPTIIKRGPPLPPIDPGLPVDPWLPPDLPPDPYDPSIDPDDVIPPEWLNS